MSFNLENELRAEISKESKFGELSYGHFLPLFKTLFLKLSAQVVIKKRTYKLASSGGQTITHGSRNTATLGRQDIAHGPRNIATSVGHNFQGSPGARMGVVITAYVQQAFGLLLEKSSNKQITARLRSLIDCFISSF